MNKIVSDRLHSCIEDSRTNVCSWIQAIPERNPFWDEEIQLLRVTIVVILASMILE